MTDRPGGPGEAAGLGALSAVVGGAVTWPLGLGPVGATVAGLNGLVCGWKGVYALDNRRGWWDWLRDSTWALPTTAAGLVVMGLQTLRGDRDYRPELSRRQGRITYGGGWRTRPGFATSIGPVVINAFDRQSLDPDDDRYRRRCRLVTRHEHQHVLQARRYGALFPVLYGGWTAYGLVRALLWKMTGDRERLGKLVATSAYYLNPFEMEAYKKDENWPPTGALADRIPGPIPG